MSSVPDNVTGTFPCAQAAARVLIPQRRGRIITLGSIHGLLTPDHPFYRALGFRRSDPPYQAAKGAVALLASPAGARFMGHHHRILDGGGHLW